MTTFGTALRELSNAQKPPKGVSVYARYVNRPAGRVLAALSFSLGLSPNQVTLVSGVFTAGGIAAVATVRPSVPLAAGVFLALVVGFALDSADGQLARLTGAGSAAGEWLDHVLDCAKMVAVHAAVLIAFSRFLGVSGAGLLLPLGFQLVAVVTFFGGILTDQLLRRAAPAAPVGPPSRLRALALLPADWGVFCAAFLLLGWRDAFVPAYAALFAVNTVLLVAFLAKWFRELSPTP